MVKESRSCVPPRGSTGALLILEQGEVESTCEARVRPGSGWFWVMGMLGALAGRWGGEGLLENGTYSFRS